MSQFADLIPQKSQKLENPFADLVPSKDPFADLIPKDASWGEVIKAAPEQVLGGMEQSVGGLAMKAQDTAAQNLRGRNPEFFNRAAQNMVKDELNAKPPQNQSISFPESKPDSYEFDADSFNDRSTAAKKAIDETGKSFEDLSAEDIESRIPWEEDELSKKQRVAVDKAADSLARKLSDYGGEKLYKKGSKRVQDATPENQTFWQEAVSTAAQSLGQQAPLAVAAFITRNPELVTTGFGVQEFGRSYGEARDAGLEPDQATRYAAVNGIVEAGTEYIPFKKVFAKDQSFAKRFVNFMAREVPGENIAELSQEVNSWANGLRDDMTVADVIETMKKTTASTLISGGAQTTAAHYLEKLSDKTQQTTLDSRGGTASKPQEVSLANIANATESELDSMVNDYLSEDEIASEELASQVEQLDDTETQDPLTGNNESIAPQIKEDLSQEVSEEDRRADPEKRVRVETLKQKLASLEGRIKEGEVSPALLSELMGTAKTLHTELTTSAKTGLLNEKAFKDFLEENPDSFVLYDDLDDFKSYNTKYQHKGVDEYVLPHIGKIKQEVAKEYGVTPFHRSGDEFLAAGTSEQLAEYGRNVQERLANATFKIKLQDGTIVEHTGVGLSYGIGQDESRAESEADIQKEQRKAAGLRKGERNAVPVPVEESGGRSDRGEREGQSEPQQTRNNRGQGLDGEQIEGSDSTRGRRERPARTSDETSENAQQGQIDKGRDQEDRVSDRATQDLIADLESGQTSQQAPSNEGVSDSIKGKASEKQKTTETEVLESSNKPGDKPSKFQGKDVKYSKTAPAFYSGLKRAADSLKQEKGTADQFLSMIKKQPGVKADELEWTGLEEYLNAKDKITKQEIVDFLDANGVQVETVEKGNADLKITDVEDIGDGEFEVYFSDKSSVIVKADSYTKARDKAHEEAKRIGEPATETKFSEYQLPGGENYREVLLTLPGKAAESPVEKSIISKYGNNFKLSELKQEERRALVAERGERNLSDESNKFRSTHFDEPNILAHIRLNDRTAADGNKVLFVEEIQSDWHQEGRKKGYKGDLLDAKFESKEQAESSIKLIGGSGFSAIEVDGKWRIKDPSKSTPNAPFKGNAWGELAIKRVLRMAAEGGYDSVAWTTGEQQADRYDLSKQVDSIGWYANKDDTYNISYKKDGRSETAQNNVSESELENLVGKDLAKKIVDQSQDAVEGNFSGLDLKVGGEGMKGFYDKILPNLFKKVAGKLDKSVSIGDTTIESEGKKQVHSIPITDTMREGAMAGQPLFKKSDSSSFSQTDKKPLGMPADRVQQIADDFLAGLTLAQDIGVTVSQKQDELFGQKSQEKGRIKGAISNDQVGLVAENMNGKSDVERVMRHEILAHYGLNTIDNKPEVLKKIKDSRDALSDIWSEVDRDYSEASEDVKAEEVFARIAETVRSWSKNPKASGIRRLWEELLKLIQSGLQKVGLIKDKTTRQEMRDLIISIAEGIRRGQRASAEGKQKFSKSASQEVVSDLIPKEVADGPNAKIVTTPIQKTVFHETSKENFNLLMSHLFDDKSKSGSLDKIYLSDNKDLAIGQGNNKGIFIEFDGSLVSGVENEKPGTSGELGEFTGREYITNYIDKKAINKITIPVGLELSNFEKRHLRRNFKLENNADGSHTYTATSRYEAVSQTDTPAFKKWFGDSKVVDENGEPLVVYHGTSEKGLKGDAFDKALLGSVTKSRSARAGFFFVPDEGIAGGYSDLANEKPVADLIAQSEKAERQGKWDLANKLIAQAEKLEQTSSPKKNVIPAYLSIKNPYEFDAGEQRFLDIQDEIHDVIKEAMDGGHDGIVLRNLIDNADWGSDKATDHWIAFEPTQIKSTSNIGRFDPSDPNILYSNPIEPVYKIWTKTAKNALDRANAAFGWKFTPLGKLPAQELYLKDRYLTLGKIADTENISKRVYETFRKLDAKEAESVYKYLTTKEANVESLSNKPVSYKWKSGKVESTVQKEAQLVKRLINRVGQSLAREGLLDKNSYEKYQDAYLPRLYLKHLLGDDAMRSFSGGKKPSDMGYLKSRKDIPKEVRELILGEITDPGYLASKSLGRSMRDLAVLDWFDRIAQKPDWALQDSLVSWKGNKVSVFWLKSEADRIRKQIPFYKTENQKKATDIVEKMDQLIEGRMNKLGAAPEGYRQAPDAPQYGRLRGMFVRTEIYNDIVGIPGSRDPHAEWWQAPFEYGGVGTKITQLWKMSKVALNPPTQIRNFISNGILLQLSGVGSHRVLPLMIQAVQDIRQNGKYWRIAKKYGITASTFANNELFKIERSFLDLKAKNAGKLSVSQLKKMAGIVGEGAGDLYQLSEGIMKTAKIIDAMKREGKLESEAVLEAQKWLYDYSLVPQSVRYFRNTPIGVPFLTFYYKTFPRMVEVALTAPHRFAPYVAIPALFAASIASDYDVEPEDVEQLKKALPDWLRDHGHLFFLPYKDQHGRWQAFDFSYLLPWSMFEQAKNNLTEGQVGEFIQTTGVIGGPIPDAISAIRTNTDAFTGKEIISEKDPPADQVKSMMNYVWSLAMPTWMTDNGFLGKMKEAGAFEGIGLKGEVDKRTGDPKLTIPQAALRLAGLNIYPVEPEASRQRNISFMGYEINEIERRMGQRLKDRNLTPEDKNNIRKVYREMIKQKQMELRDYRKNSKIHPNLKGEKVDKNTQYKEAS